MFDYEKHLAGRESRRLKAEDRFLIRRERLERAAESMIGEICRAGKVINYVFPIGGRYREGDFYELVDFLIRNKYV